MNEFFKYYSNESEAINQLVEGPFYGYANDTKRHLFYPLEYTGIILEDKIDRVSIVEYGGNYEMIEPQQAYNFDINLGVAYYPFFTEISTAGDLFNNPEYLNSIIIPEGVETIGEGAFYACYDLSYVELPESLTTISPGAFFECAIHSITIPKNVACIKDAAFAFCANLTQVTCEAIVPPQLQYGNEFMDSPVEVIYVPAESLEDYKNATNWDVWADIMQPIPNKE